MSLLLFIQHGEISGFVFPDQHHFDCAPICTSKLRRQMMAKALQGNKVLSEARSLRNDLKVLGFSFVCFLLGFPVYGTPLEVTH